MNNKVKSIVCLFYMLGLNAVAQAQSTVATNVSTTTTSGFFSKEKWGVSYLNYVNGPAFSDASGVSINHYLTLKHKFSKDWSLSASLRPDSNFGNGEESFQMGDSYLKLITPTIFKGDNVKVTGQLRYYAPMSEASKNSKINGKFSPRIYATASSGKFDFMYVLIPTLYLNSVSEDGQKLGSHGHSLSTNYNLTDKFTLDFEIYPSWSYSSGKPVAFNKLPVYPGVSMNFTESLSVSTYLEIISGQTDSKTTSAGASLSYTML